MQLIVTLLILINSLTSTIYGSEPPIPTLSDSQLSPSEKQSAEKVVETIDSISETIGESLTWKTTLTSEQLMTLINIHLYSGLPFEYDIHYKNTIISDKEEVYSLIRWLRENKDSIDYCILSNLYYDSLNDGALISALIGEFHSDIRRKTKRGLLIGRVIREIKAKYARFPLALESITDSEELTYGLYNMGTDTNSNADNTPR